MKTTIDIPDKVLDETMKFTKAKTKREGVVRALEQFNRAENVRMVLDAFGKFKNFPTNEELEAADLEEARLKTQLWNRGEEE